MEKQFVIRQNSEMLFNIKWLRVFMKKCELDFEKHFRVAGQGCWGEHIEFLENGISLKNGDAIIVQNKKVIWKSN